MTCPESPTPELASRLAQIGLRSLPPGLDDFLARATRGRWSPRQMLEELARAEESERSRRSLERRLRHSRIGRFKPIADFDWNWPKKIDRPVIERALTLDFIPEGRNLILLGTNGLGKTMISKNIAHAAVLAGYSVLFRTASEILDDLQCDSLELQRRKLKKYARPQLLCIDELGYLSYDHHAADLLYEIVNRRYERRSIIVTTNRAFKEWNQVFPNATCIATLLDRLTHHADFTVLEGSSYRVRESEQEAQKRRKQP
jgi:DNA replication protein DnaC